MTILLVNSFYYNRGGDCTYFFSLKELLEKKEHKVPVFSMHHPQNLDSDYSRYFASYIDYVEEAEKKKINSGIKVLYRTVYSQEAKEKIETLIEQEKPDIAHLQSIHHHLTPSILYPLKKRRIPIIWTLHDYVIMCPNTTFFCQGKICERCKKTKYYWPPVVRCKKNSFLASTMAALENTVHRIMGVYDMVDLFITPSQFLKHKLLEYGFAGEKIAHLNHFIDTNSVTGGDEESIDSYYLYVGRLSEEKGVNMLIDAALQVGTMRLKIIGKGPLENELLRCAASKRSDIVEFVGHKSRSETLRILKNSSFAVLPSLWYENLPYSILEAFACGKPVIGSDIGGIPALVINGITGLLFEPNHVGELAQKIEWMTKHPQERSEMGKKARQLIERKFNREEHYMQLMAIYKDALQKY